MPRFYSDVRVIKNDGFYSVTTVKTIDFNNKPDHNELGNRLIDMLAKALMESDLVGKTHEQIIVLTNSSIPRVREGFNAEIINSVRPFIKDLPYIFKTDTATVVDFVYKAYTIQLCINSFSSLSVLVLPKEDELT